MNSAAEFESITYAIWGLCAKQKQQNSLGYVCTAHA